MGKLMAVFVALTLVVSGCTQDTGAPTEGSPDTAPDTAPDPETIQIPDAYLACLYLGGIVAVEQNSAEAAVGALPDNVEPVELTAADAFALVNSLRDESEVVTYDEEVVQQIDSLIDFVGTSGDPIQVSLALQEIGIAASPIHAIGLATHWGFGPGDSPSPVEGELDNPGDEAGREYVGVVDSGIDDSALPPWMQGQTVVYEAEDLEVIPGDVSFASHGTFVASIIRRIAPSFGVSLAKAHVVPGTAFTRWPREDHDPEFFLSNELDVANAVVRLAQRNLTYAGLNLSLGAYICDPATDAQLVALSGVLSSWSGVPIVAAAGNKTLRVPFWPAALGSVTATAASNGTDIVDWSTGSAKAIAYTPVISPLEATPGVHLVGLRGGVADDGTSLVAWSGSSFATAVASALTVQSMSLTTDYTQVPGLSYLDPNGGLVINP